MLKFLHLGQPQHLFQTFKTHGSTRWNGTLAGIVPICNSRKKTVVLKCRRKP